MKTIWKFVITPTCTLDIPKDAEVLSIKNQGENICMWVKVDPSNATEERKFVVCGTGHTLPELELEFIDSVLLFDGGLVFHVFEVKR